MVKQKKKQFVVLMEQAELFKVEVEASDRSQAIDFAHTKFSQGDYTEAGEVTVVCTKVYTEEEWKKQNR